MYKCKICGKEMPNMNGVSLHVRHKHNIEYKEYIKKYEPSMYIEQEYSYQCKICGKKFTRNIVTRFDLSFAWFNYRLIDHLNKAHKLTIEEYIDEYDDSLRKTYNELNNHRQQLVKCQICGRQLKSINVNHLKYKHNITLDEYKKKYPNSLTLSINTHTLLSKHSKKINADPIIRAKIEKTNLKKYGTKAPTQSLIIKAKVEKTFLKKYGEKRPYFGSENTISNEEIQFKILLEKLNIKFEIQKRVKTEDDILRYFDFYLPDYDLYIEIDGCFWHGLDRTNNYDIVQLFNMQRDLIKNNMVKNLVRIECNDIQTMEKNCFDGPSLVVTLLESNIPYYRKCVGTKDRMPDKIKLVNNPTIVTRNQILLCDKEYRQLLPRNILSFIRNDTKNEFPYPEFNLDKFKKEFNKLSSLNVDIIKSNEEVCLNSNYDYLCNIATTSLYQHFFKTNLKNKQSTYDIFYDDEKLLKVLEYRCGLNNSKLYEYKVNNEIIKDHETFTVNMNSIRRGINSMYHSAPSSFSSVLGKRMILTLISLLKLNEDKQIIIYDPFGGWGNRMIAAASFLNFKIHYIYNEANNKSVDSSNKLGEILTTLNNNFSFEVATQNFNIDNIPEYDICITCPPYSDKEQYTVNSSFKIQDVFDLENSMIVYERYNKEFFAQITHRKSHFNKSSTKEFLYLNKNS